MNTEARIGRANVNVMTVTDLLVYFDGKSSGYDTWECQAYFLKTTYRLENDITRIFIGMRLKDKALE